MIYICTIILVIDFDQDDAGRQFEATDGQMPGAAAGGRGTRGTAALAERPHSG